MEIISLDQLGQLAVEPILVASIVDQIQQQQTLEVKLLQKFTYSSSLLACACVTDVHRGQNS